MGERSHRRLGRRARSVPHGRVGHDSRTSCVQRQATAFLAAHFSASSRAGTSTTQNPPMASAYGPSVTVPSVATMLAFWCSSPPPKTQTPAFMASSTTSCAALATAGMSSSGMCPSRGHRTRSGVAASDGPLSRRPAPAASRLRLTNHQRLIACCQIQPRFSGLNFQPVFGRRLWTACDLRCDLRGMNGAERWGTSTKSRCERSIRASWSDPVRCRMSTG